MCAPADGSCTRVNPGSTVGLGSSFGYPVTENAAITAGRRLKGL